MIITIETPKNAFAQAIIAMCKAVKGITYTVEETQTGNIATPDVNLRSDIAVRAAAIEAGDRTGLMQFDSIEDAKKQLNILCFVPILTSLLQCSLEIG
jgi:hypothetical protein